MKKRIFSAALAAAMAVNLAACGTQVETASVNEPAPTEAPAAEEAAPAESSVADSSEMSEVIEVVEEGMVPITGEQLKDGTYDVEVSSSSSMFNIESCELTVKDGEMTAVMTMGGTGYLYLYLGTGAEADAAEESSYIPFEESTEGVHTFTIPVEALDAPIDCAAFSKRKEKWYERVILFRADSLPAEAFAEERFATAESLGLEDGLYTAEVTLEGGSGRASVESPAQFKVEDGKCVATIQWSSNRYDFMVVEGETLMPVNTEGNSTFEVPFPGFDYKVPVQADTTAMSQAHLIDYTLTFASETIQPVATN